LSISLVCVVPARTAHSAPDGPDLTVAISGVWPRLLYLLPGCAPREDGTTARTGREEARPRRHQKPGVHHGEQPGHLAARLMAAVRA
jgi:hypothetical protein